MLGLSMTEVVIILGLALILLGPDQLPTIAKSIGKGMREIRKATDDLKSTFEQEMVRMDEPVDAAPPPPAPSAPPAPAPPPRPPARGGAARGQPDPPPRPRSAGRSRICPGRRQALGGRP